MEMGNLGQYGEKLRGLWGGWGDWVQLEVRNGGIWANLGEKPKTEGIGGDLSPILGCFGAVFGPAGPSWRNP